MISILTPTFNRAPHIVKRCLYSVRSQINTQWEQLVCSDGVCEPEIQDMMKKDFDSRQIYSFSDRKLGHYGAGVRDYLMKYCRGKYICCLDDDNILFPDYLQEMSKALDANPDAGFAISRTLYLGELARHIGVAPKILTGIPPVLQNIDTIQVMVRKEVMLESGWILEGYLSDGYTYQKLGEMYKWIEVPKLLSVHMDKD